MKLSSTSVQTATSVAEMQMTPQFPVAADNINCFAYSNVTVEADTPLDPHEYAAKTSFKHKSTV